MSISKSFTLFSVWSIVITFALIVIGSVVRTTGSGDACPDWPLCYGRIIPPFELRIWIEWTHRLVNTLVVPSVLILAIWATLRYRQDKLIFRGAWLAVILLVIQIALGGLVVLLQLPLGLVGIHLANALLILATLVMVSLYAYRPWANAPVQSDRALRRLIVISTVAVYALIISGSIVTDTNSAMACLQDWPLCNSGFVPNSLAQAINLAHRYFAAAVGVLLIYTLVETLRRQGANPLLRRAAHSAIGIFVLQIVIGGINVFARFQALPDSLHIAAATAVWGAMVAYAVIGWHVLSGQQSAASSATGVNSVGQSYTPAASGD